MKKLIVPIDFSTASAVALRFADRLSRGTQLQLSVVYVHNSMVVSNHQDTHKEEAANQEVLETQLRTFVTEQLNVSMGADVETLVAEGIPPVYLKQLSLREEVALMVMAAVSSKSGAHVELFGNISTMVSQEGGCPILLIPKDYRETSMRELLALFRSPELVATGH